MYDSNHYTKFYYNTFLQKLWHNLEYCLYFILEIICQNYDSILSIILLIHVQQYDVKNIPKSAVPKYETVRHISNFCLILDAVEEH